MTPLCKDRLKIYVIDGASSSASFRSLPSISRSSKEELYINVAKHLVINKTEMTLNLKC